MRAVAISCFSLCQYAIHHGLDTKLWTDFNIQGRLRTTVEASMHGRIVSVKWAEINSGPA